MKKCSVSAWWMLLYWPLILLSYTGTCFYCRTSPPGTFKICHLRVFECIQPRRRTRGKHYECGLIEWQGTCFEQGQMWLVASERGKPTNQPASSQPYSNSFVAATRNSPFKFHFCFTSSPWFGCVWLGHHSSAFYQSENHKYQQPYIFSSVQFIYPDHNFVVAPANFLSPQGYRAPHIGHKHRITSL